jgi:hypothetical protein
MIWGFIVKIRTTIYIEPGLWKEFKKVCFSNGWSMSVKIEECVQTIVDKHGEGGSQSYFDVMSLDGIIPPSTLPKYKTCQHSDKAKAKGEFYCRYTNHFKGHGGGWYPTIRCSRCEFYEVNEGVGDG